MLSCNFCVSYDANKWTFVICYEALKEGFNTHFTFCIVCYGLIFCIFVLQYPFLFACDRNKIPEFLVIDNMKV